MEKKIIVFSVCKIERRREKNGMKKQAIIFSPKLRNCLFFLSVNENKTYIYNAIPGQAWQSDTSALPEIEENVPAGHGIGEPVPLKKKCICCFTVFFSVGSIYHV